MDNDLQWIIGLVATIALAFGSALIGAFWKLVAMVKKVEDSMEANDKELHARINQVTQTTVQKADLDSQVGRINEELREMRSEQREASRSTNERLDRLLDAMVTKGKQ